MLKLSSLAAWLRKRSPRMLLPNIMSIVLIMAVAALAPHQAPVLLYKLGGVLAAACMGHWIDLTLNPYGQPSGYLCVDWRTVDKFDDNKPDYAIVPGYERTYNLATLRRAAIVCACMLAVALAL